MIGMGAGSDAGCVQAGNKRQISFVCISYNICGGGVGLEKHYPFENTPLPYAYGALEPYIDEKTMQLHHNRHLKTYITYVLIPHIIGCYERIRQIRPILYNLLNY